MKKIFVLVMFLTCIISSLADAASLSAKVSRDTVIQGETLNLTLTYDGSQTNLQPDFAPLDENFNIFGVSSAYQHSNINGQISQKREWVAQLMPKKTGNLVIPALKLGNMKSNAVDIKVLEASPENMKHSEHNLQENSHRYAVEAEIDNLSPYVQQEVNMTIKVFDTGGLRVERIVPMVNDENNWVIRSLGEPEFESQVIDGHSVRVVKIKLALFPQKSGVLDLPEIAVEGYYLTKNKDPFNAFFADGFGQINLSQLDPSWGDIFSSRQNVTLMTKPQKIDIKPIPQNYDTAWWVPAESLELYSEWKPNPPKFRVGEAVTRNIYIRAVGVIDNQLPNIGFGENAGLQQYPEKPINEMKVENGKIVAYRMISNVYIPSVSGRVEVPEISVKWFNTKTQKTEEAKLPKLNIVVENNPNISEAAAQNNFDNSGVSDEITPSAPTITPSDNAIPQTETTSEFSIWMIFAAFGAGIVLTFLVIMFVRSKKSFETTEKQIKNFNKAVISAAQKNDLKSLRDCLIEWGKDNYPDFNISTLKDLAQAVENDKFKESLQKLNASLYAKNHQDWNSQEFVVLFENLCKKKKAKPKKDKLLPDLYK